MMCSYIDTERLLPEHDRGNTEWLLTGHDRVSVLYLMK